jgi:hypothetical protein
MRFILIVFNLVLFILPMGAQSGWTKEKGKYFTKLDFSNFVSTAYFNPSGNQLLTSEFRQRSVHFYGEYGITDRFTIIGSMPLLRLNSFETTKTVAGIGDLRLEFKYKPFKNLKLPMAVSIAPELPTGRKNAFAENKFIPGEKINLPAGDGEFNIWGTLAVSLPFSKKGYTSFYGSYNLRTAFEGLDFQDLYQVGFEIGYNPFKSFWLNAKLRSQYTIADSEHPELAFVRGDATTYTLLSAEAFYKINDRFGISATFLTGNEWLASFQNIYIAPYFSVGVIYEKK